MLIKKKSFLPIPQPHHIINGFILLIFFITNTAHATTLTHALSQALLSNPNVKAAQADVRSDFYAMQETRAGYFPNINLTAAAGREYSRNPTLEALGENSRVLTRREANVTLQQLMFDGFRTYYRVTESTTQWHATRWQLQTVLQTVAQQSVEAYYNVNRYRALLRIAQNNVRVHKETLEKVRKRAETKVGNKVEVALATSRLSLAYSNLRRIKGLLLNAEQRYFAIIGSMPIEHLRQPTPFNAKLPKQLAQAKNFAVRHNPRLNRARENIHGQRANIASNRAAFAPRVDLALQLSNNNNLDGIEGDNNDASAFIKVRYDIFNGGQRFQTLKRSRAGLKREQHRFLAVERDVIETLENAWTDHQTAQQQVVLLKDYARRSQEVVDGYKKQFTLGKRPLFNVLDAENEFFSARLNLVNAQYDAAIASYRLLAEMGILVQTLLPLQMKQLKKLAQNTAR